MSLLDDLETATDRGVGSRCTFGLLLEGMTPADADALRAAIAGPLRSATLSDVLRANGHLISADTVQRHRRRDCKCP